MQASCECVQSEIGNFTTSNRREHRLIALQRLSGEVSTATALAAIGSVAGRSICLGTVATEHDGQLVRQ